MATPQDAAHAQAVGNALLVYVTCLSSILWWDVLSTLPREINMVWKPFFSDKRKSPLFSIGLFTVIFFTIARWLCVIQFILIVWSLWRVWSPESCEKFYLFDSVVSAVVVASASGIMSIRVSALWGRRKTLDYPLLAAWMALTAIVMWASTGVTPVPGVPYCIAKQTHGNQLNALYLGPMIFDVIILSLTVGSAVQHKRNGRVGPLLQHLVRDGIWYFLAVFTCNLLAVAFEFQNLDPALKPVNASLATIGTSIFISRLFLSMREAVLKGVEIPTFHSDAIQSGNSKSPRWNKFIKHSPKNREVYSPKHTEMPTTNRVQDIELSTEIAVDFDEDSRSTNSKARLSHGNELEPSNRFGDRGLGIQAPTSLPFDGENSVRSASFTSPRLTTVGDSLQYDKNIVPSSVRQD